MTGRALALLALLGACSGDPVPSNVAPATPIATPGTDAPTPVNEMPDGVPAQPDIFYIGRWNGPDGASLVVTDPPQGGVGLELRTADGREQRLQGSVTAEGLRFMRGGEAEIAVPVTGKDTGVAALAGKRDCLSIRDDEAYCRD